jgi:hypothetical protein
MLTTEPELQTERNLNSTFILKIKRINKVSRVNQE